MKEFDPHFDPYDERAVFAELSTLINGMDCKLTSKKQMQEGVIYAKDKQIIQSSSTDKKISFAERFLKGGILQKD